MFRLLAIKLLILAAVYRQTKSHASDLFGPVGELIVESVKKCNDRHLKEDNTILKYDIELVKDENDETMFNGKLNLLKDLDDSFTFIISATPAADRGFGFFLDGTLCGQFKHLVPGLWKKVTETVGVPSECPIPAGDYSLEGFRITAQEAEIPIIEYGHFDIKTVILKNDKPVFCQVIELRSFPPGKLDDEELNEEGGDADADEEEEPVEEGQAEADPAEEEK